MSARGGHLLITIIVILGTLYFHLNAGHSVACCLLALILVRPKQCLLAVTIAWIFRTGKSLGGGHHFGKPSQYYLTIIQLCWQFEARSSSISWFLWLCCFLLNTICIGLSSLRCVIGYLQFNTESKQWKFRENTDCIAYHLHVGDQ